MYDCIFGDLPDKSTVRGSGQPYAYVCTYDQAAVHDAWPTISMTKQCIMHDQAVHDAWPTKGMTKHVHDA